MYFIDIMYRLIGTIKQPVYPVLLSCSASNDAKKEAGTLRTGFFFSSIYLFIFELYGSDQAGRNR